MSPLAEAVINAKLAEQVLLAPTLEERSALLLAADLLTPDGLAQLLDAAAQLMRGDPGRGRELAELCAELAPGVGAAELIPRARYICAQAHTLNAEFDTALRLMDEARQGYIAIGEPIQALRTYVGEMSVLIDLGRYPEALDTGQTVLDGLAAPGLAADPDTTLIAGLVHLNRGSCYDQMGQYDEALAAYAAAEDRYRALGMTEYIGHVANNRGVVLLSLGRGSEALAAFEFAASLFSGAGLTLLQAQTLGNIGDAHLLLSNYTRSLDALERARQLLDPLDAEGEKHVLLLDTADAYTALNLYPEALNVYHEADRLLQSAGMPHHRARALWGMGATLIAQSQLGQATRALDQAVELFAKIGNLPMLSSVMLEQAALLAASQRRAAALAIAEESLALVAAGDRPVQHIYAHMRIADLVLPDLERAERHLLEAQRRSESLMLPHLRYRLNQRLGHIRMLQGRSAEAERLLEAAVNEIERLRGTLAHEATRTSFLHDKVVAFEDLVRLYLDRGGPGDARAAFTIAERAKSRALVDLLAGGIGARADASAAPYPQARQADLNAVYNELLGGAGDSQRRSNQAELQARAAELEREISLQRLQGAALAAHADRLSEPLALDAIAERIPADLALVAYQIVGSEIVAFVVRDGELRVARSLGTLAAVQPLIQRLSVQWDRFRVGQAFVSAHLPQLEQSAQRILLALYRALFEPIEALLGPGDGGLRRIAIVPHGPLHQVPFHALYDGRQYLIDRYEIGYAPSATVLAICQQREPNRASTALILGVPDPLIPAVGAEVGAVSRHLAGARLRLGEHATIKAFRHEAPGSALLHLACHGLFRADNPMFSALRLADGWLTAADVLELDLAGALVTLSACESGRSQVIGGDEILGLTRAFLGAGATTVVVSLWLVQDETTAQLMSSWYQQMPAGGAAAGALRAAQLSVKAQHPHPYYWAPFVLVGKR